ncbi:MAG: caspase family protein [Saprospiraceae bacterium]|nr:caspase family protein [Saprospiraceae bacterium]
MNAIYKFITVVAILLSSHYMIAQDRGLINGNIGQTLGSNTTEKRLALCIGNDRYLHLNSLGGQPINDANDMTTQLRELGFDVMPVLTNASKNQIQSTLRSFAEKLKNYDVGLFFYAGHGASADGNNFILSKDIPAQPFKADVKEYGISDQYIMDLMNESGDANKTHILIYDACRSVVRGEGNGQVWVQPSTIPNSFLLVLQHQ